MGESRSLMKEENQGFQRKRRLKTTINKDPQGNLINKSNRIETCITTKVMQEELALNGVTPRDEGNPKFCNSSFKAPTKRNKWRRRRNEREGKQGRMERKNKSCGESKKEWGGSRLPTNSNHPLILLFPFFPPLHTHIT